MDRKFIKYVFTALVLIVVAILIMTSINNWNQMRLHQMLKHRTLSEIDRNLELDARALEEVHDAFLVASAAFEKISQSTNRSEIQDSLQWWLGNIIQFERFRPIRTGYEKLPAVGVMVQNQQLQSALMQYYNNQMVELTQLLHDVERAYNIDWEPKIKAEFSDFKFKQYASPRDASRWISREDNKFLIQLFMDKRERALKSLEESLVTLKAIRSDISSDLKPQ